MDLSNIFRNWSIFLNSSSYVLRGTRKNDWWVVKWFIWYTSFLNKKSISLNAEGSIPGAFFYFYGFYIRKSCNEINSFRYSPNLWQMVASVGLVSVAASVVAYYICKWLDGDDWVVKHCKVAWSAAFFNIKGTWWSIQVPFTWQLFLSFCLVEL